MLSAKQFIQHCHWRPERYLRNVPQKNFADVTFFSKSSSFSRLRKALDCRVKEMTATGIGVSVKRADTISPDDELAL